MAYDGLSQRTQRIDSWAETGSEEPPEGRGDRLAIHGIWEGLLLVIVMLTAVAVYQVDADVLLGGGLQSFLLLATSLGLMAVGAAWSLRGAVPNLAVGSVAAASATFFAEQAPGGLTFGFGVTVAAAIIIGVVLTLVVVGFQVPPWAASLGAALLLGGWVVARGATELPDDVSYDPRDHALYWFLGFAGLTLVGGLLSLAGPVRRGFGAYRPSGDPAERPGFGAGVAALTALVGSCVLAACGGVLAVLTAGTVAPDTGFAWTGIALAAALIGGVSGYGRRGGLAGTLLGVLLLALGLRLAGEEHWKISTLEYAGVAILLGLLVTRLVESAGRPRPSGGGSGGDEAEPREMWSGGSSVDVGQSGRPASPGSTAADRGVPDPRVPDPGSPGSGGAGERLAGLGRTARVIDVPPPGAEPAPGTSAPGAPGSAVPGAPRPRGPASGGPGGGLPQRGGIGDRAARLQQGLAGVDPLSRTRSWDPEPPAGSGSEPSPY